MFKIIDNPIPSIFQNMFARIFNINGYSTDQVTCTFPAECCRAYAFLKKKHLNVHVSCIRKITKMGG